MSKDFYAHHSYQKPIKDMHANNRKPVWLLHYLNSLHLSQELDLVLHTQCIVTNVENEKCFCTCHHMVPIKYLKMGDQ